LFASTRGGMFGDSSAYDGVYFLIDADGNPSTGYQFEGIGAEGVVEVFGSNNTVAGARLYGFPTNSEVNWSQRQSLGSPSAAASVQGVEAQVSTYDLTRFDPARFRIAVFVDDFAAGVSPGNVVQIDVTNATAPVPVVIRGGPIRAYVVGPPSTVRVDGLFADWIGRDQMDSDPVPVQNPDVNIVRYGAAVNTSAA